MKKYYVLVFLSIIISINIFADYFSGHVYHDDSGLPIYNAEIRIGNSYSYPYGTEYTGTTDVTGYYLIDGIPTDNDYTLVVSCIGYISEYIQMQTPTISPSGDFNFEIHEHDSGYLAQTINRGNRQYLFNGNFVIRVDGTVTENESGFPDIDAQSDTIDYLMADINAGTTPTNIDSLVWEKCYLVWNWLENNARSDDGSQDWEDANDLMMSEGWPSIQLMAETFMIYGFIPWGTCYSRSYILTTLLYQTGISKERVATEIMDYKLRYTQHAATIVYLQNRWFFLDPTSMGTYFPPTFEEFTSIPMPLSTYKDYCHPYELKTIPGSLLEEVPEISGRNSNSEYIFIKNPPNLTHTLRGGLTIHGFADQNISQVFLNGNSFPVINGNFTGFLPLDVGENPIVAEVTFLFETYQDSILIYRDSTSYFQPAVPENLQIEISATNDAILNWSPVNATIYGNHLITEGYSVYFCIEPTGTFSQLNSTMIPDPNFVHPNIGNYETKGFYQISAIKFE